VTKASRVTRIPIDLSATLSQQRLRCAQIETSQNKSGQRKSISTVWAFYVNLAVPMRLPDAGRHVGSNLPHSDFGPILQANPALNIPYGSVKARPGLITTSISGKVTPEWPAREAVELGGATVPSLTVLRC
jgi:hypothetical protein